MKPHRAFIADRAAAQHCGELLRAGPAQCGPRDPAAILARALPHLEAALARGIADFTGADAPSVSCEPPRLITHSELARGLPALAGICALGAGAQASPMLAVFDPGVVFAQVDRAFGGEGLVPDPLPEAFPLSAELMLGRLESVVTGAVIHAFCLSRAATVRPLARGTRLALVSPLQDEDSVHVLRLTVIETVGDPWRVTLALPAPALAALLVAGEGDHGPDPAPQAAQPERDPLEGPYAAMPLTLAATLVDMALPFSAIARLRVGDILPVAVARSVPVSIGGQVIAHGTVGECDDRVALRLTQTF